LGFFVQVIVAACACHAPTGGVSSFSGLSARRIESLCRRPLADPAVPPLAAPPGPGRRRAVGRRADRVQVVPRRAVRVRRGLVPPRARKAESAAVRLAAPAVGRSALVRRARRRPAAQVAAVRRDRAPQVAMGPARALVLVVVPQGLAGRRLEGGVVLGRSGGAGPVATRARMQESSGRIAPAVPSGVAPAAVVEPIGSRRVGWRGR
jgi:hypothetical protein